MKFKPCPFCGSEVKHLEKFDVVYCSNVECGLHYENGGGYTVEYWNTRPIEDNLQAEIERLKEALEQALVYVESDELSHGRQFGTGNAIREALERTGQ